MTSILYSSVRIEADAARISSVTIGLFLMAIFQAGITVSHVFIVLLNAHPTTFRSAKSTMMVRYNHP